MHDPQQQSNPPKRSHALRSLIALIGAVALLTILVLVWNLPPRLNSQQVVNQLGTYRFPTGNNTLQIAKDQSGNLAITVYRQTTRFYFIPHTLADTPITFESEREWFVSVDNYQRLWVYHGYWDQTWGEVRQMPSEGIVPYSPAVSRCGLHFTGNGELVSGFNLVTETGDWVGVPAEFLDRIRENGLGKWNVATAIPDSAPPLTRRQELQLESVVR